MERLTENTFAALDYEGVNVGAVVTNQGNIAIDTPSYPRDARDWAMQLHSLSPHPTQALLLTDGQGDRMINARWMNAPLYVHTDTAEKINGYDRKYPHNLLESLVMRNPDKGRDLHNSPVERPSISFDTDITITRGNTAVIAIAAPGPTTGNIWVYVPEAAVLFTGDTLVANSHPLLYAPTLTAWLQTLETLRTWPHPVHTIVPGRGPLCTRDEIDPIVAYLTDMQQRVQQLWEDGRSRDETITLLPTFLSRFPTHRLPIEWLKRQIKISLAHTYDEIKLAQSDTTIMEANAASTDE